MHKTEAAYVAGLIDGEGWVTITRTPAGYNRRKTTGYQLSVGIAMTHRPTIEVVQSLFDGTIRYHKGRKDAHAATYHLGYTDNNSVRILTEILPYMCTKKPQALLGIAFRTVTKQAPGAQNVPPELQAEREEYYNQMRMLNTRGPKIDLTTSE